MTDASVAEHADALRAHLTRYRPTEGFALLGVREEGDEVAVVFRWRRNPHHFVVRFGRDFAAFFAEEEGAGLDAWCEDVGFWLMEELDTGLLARADRQCAGAEVVLTSPSDRHRPTEVSVHDVPQFEPEVRLPWRLRARLAVRGTIARWRGRPATYEWAAWAPTDQAPGDGRRDGEWLEEVGLDAAGVRAIRDEGGFLAWLQAWGSEPGRVVVGQCAVAATSDPDVAAVVVLGVTDGAPSGARQELVVAAVHTAADQGARTVLVPTADGGTEAVDTALC
ncbi:hypothetical protein NMQ01_08940 [Janibacter sp. CX7]|uniref:hypothetical protein n=1 Tax=Janibacter sp. CX7 TaxID=2963431 RepID=UPI0020CF02DF|nr:hypothetical protein [Janibacter sp. CX7]UTT64865.1 hypothetical protein NMQ01_08940 [Janibacter sp. CX7]